MLLLADIADRRQLGKSCLQPGYIIIIIIIIVMMMMMMMVMIMITVL